MKRHLFIRIMLVLAAACLSAAALFFLWLQGCFLPGWIEWNPEKTVVSEVPAVSAGLKGKQVFIHKDGRLLWESPAEYKVQDILLCDIDHDDENEILLLCWKIGRYGAHKPFYVKADEKTWSQHIFIYSLEEGRVKAEWMASYLPVDVAGWSFNESDRLILREPSGRTGRWDWLQWGLECLEEP